MAKASVTSTDVAKHAQVSQSAVSRTFTPGASVSQETKQKVLTAAKALGYRPNKLARSLISGRSNTVGLVVAYLENHFYPIVIEQLSRALQAHGYHILLFMTEPGKQDEVIQEILQYQIDGVVLASVTLSSHIAEECAELGVPVVLFNRYVPDSPASSVTSDNVSGAYQLADYLIKQGHRRFAYIAGHENSSTNQDRERGFNQRLAEDGLTIEQREVGHYLFNGAEDAVRRLLNDNTTLPDAIFVANDHMAFAVMDVIRSEFKLRIPEDISVVGYDDVPEAAWSAYDLTTVTQPVAEMVAVTVDILLKQMEHQVVSPEHRLTASQLMIRGSASASKSAENP